MSITFKRGINYERRGVYKVGVKKMLDNET
jgi:hypothetical protein